MATISDEQLKAVKTAQYAKEFKEAAKEVMFNAVKLKDPEGR